ncbi:hypothetical protein MA16_Dca003986 [Dendrobium catenatum]|uniref:Uncharacterized protein n=1 Tax=Dendrobium catenatum TaxID=906689 RepID=A0A2I0X235_9ASPA|nr:hypothetical protein MA16_Dca003986 [Dendrobium catenatum]
MRWSGGGEGPAEVRASSGGPAEQRRQAVVRRSNGVRRWSGGATASGGGPAEQRRQAVVLRRLPSMIPNKKKNAKLSRKFLPVAGVADFLCSRNQPSAGAIAVGQCVRHPRFPILLTAAERQLPSWIRPATQRCKYYNGSRSHSSLQLSIYPLPALRLTHYYHSIRRKIIDEEEEEEEEEPAAVRCRAELC